MSVPVYIQVNLFETLCMPKFRKLFTEHCYSNVNKKDLLFFTFQSMTYTFGICGPLKMTVNEAALLNTLYYAAFVSGRLSGILISRYKKNVHLKKPIAKNFLFSGCFHLEP